MATTTKGIYYPNDGTQSADVLTDMKKMAESIDTAIDGDQFDPTQINESIENLKQDVTALQNSQSTQDLAIENLQGAFLNKTTEEVQSLQVDDANGLGKLDVLGNYIQDGEPSEISPVEIKCVGDNKKNLFSLDNRIENIRVNSDYEIESDDKFVTFYSKLEESEYYIITCKRSSGYTSYTRLYYGYFDEMPKVGMEARDGGTFYDKDLNNRSIYTSGKYFAISFKKEIVDKKWIYDIQLEKGETATPYIPYGQGSTEIKIENEDKTQFKSYTLPIQQEMLKGDYFVKEADGWKEVHNWQKIDSYNGESISTDYVSTTGALTTGATVFYKITTPVKLACTEEQVEVLEQLNNLELFKGTNYITTTEGIAILKLKYEADESEKCAELSNEIEELKQDLEASMLKNTTEQDTSLYINDASQARGKLSIFGNIKQETTKGLQILQDTNEGTKGWGAQAGQGQKITVSSIIENGIDCVKFVPNETLTSHKYFYRNCNRNKLKNNTTYTLQFEYKSNVISKIVSYIQDDDGSNRFLNWGNFDYGENDIGKWKKAKAKAISTDVELKAQILYLQTSITNTTDYVEIRNLILVEGDYSNKDLEWEKYTGVEQMPNLNYPSPIKTLKDSTDITFSNKNLVPALTKNSNYICRCKKGDIFSIQLKGTSTSDTRVGIRTYDGEFNDNLNSYVDQKWLQADGTEQTATITSSTDGFVYLRLAGGPPIYTFDYVQVEKGSIATDIVEHKESNYIVPIQKPFYKIGDYADNFIKQNGKWYEQHYIAKFDLSNPDIDWQEDGAKQTINTLRWYSSVGIQNINKPQSKDTLSNYFSINNADYHRDTVGYNIERAHVRVRLPINISTPEQVKAFWQEKAKILTPYIYYVLSEPVLVECTEEQSKVLDQLSQMRFYRGANNIFTTEDIALLQAEYGVDIKTYIDNRLANINAQILDIVGGN